MLAYQVYVATELRRLTETAPDPGATAREDYRTGRRADVPRMLAGWLGQHLVRAGNVLQQWSRPDAGIILPQRHPQA